MRCKAIDVSKVTKAKQVEKFIEEVEEFYTAIANNDIENLKEEYCDLLTAGAGVLLKYGVTEEEIERYFNNEHMLKLLSRGFKPRELREEM